MPNTTLSYARQSLLLGSAAAALVATQPAMGQVAAVSPAAGQKTAAAPETVSTDEPTMSEDIVVTGSSIRGVPPTGSALVQLGAEDVTTTGATTTQELLASVPQLSTFNTAPTAGQRSNSQNSTAPNIRGIGQGATLSLVNGHRIVAVGALQNLPDPSFVPPAAIQRVEIVADGASATYGSDAIAGVVNVITRRDFNGLLGTFRTGYGDKYNVLNGNIVAGSKWDSGGIIASVEYSKSSRLRAADRSYLTQDFSSVGGQDQRAIGNACQPATYRYNNASNAPTGSYFQPATGAVDPRCTNYQYGDLYPKQDRLSFFAAGHQEIAPGFEIGFDAFHSQTNSEAAAAPIYTTGVMTRANPFFPSTVPANVNSITAYYTPFFLSGDANGAGGRKDRSYLYTYGGTLTADVDLGRFKWSTYLTGSRNKTDVREASFNSTLNGQLIAANSAATAIDPFGDRTSESTRVGLLNFENHFRGLQAMWEVNSKIDGALFTLPAGDLKIAVGGNYRFESYDGLFASTRIGFDEGAQLGIGNRKVYSGFAELFIPVFGENNGFAFMRALDISLSGRIDHYSDFGATKNPKVGVRWAPVRGLNLRGSYGRSFHAPALNDLYAPDTRAGYLTNGTLPPGFAQGAVPGGIFIAGGDRNLGPETAESWSLGFDLTPEIFSGFRMSATYYSMLFKDRISTPSRTFYTDPNFRRFIIDNFACDAGATYNPANPTAGNCKPIPIPADKVWSTLQGLSLVSFPAPVNSAADLPPIYNITLLRRANLSVIKTSGIDFDTSYRWDMDGVAMTAQVQGNYVLNYDQAAISGAALVDQFPLGQPRFRARGTISARTGPANMAININYSGSYQRQYTLLNTLQATETVDPFTTVDTYFGLQLPDTGLLAGTLLTLNIDNLLNAPPPFQRGGNGYGNGNILGRVVMFGIQKTF